MNENKGNTYIITAGSTYLDIDAYACMLGMAELLRLKNIPVVAWSDAPCNYSVCKTLVEEGQVLREMPSNFDGETAKYIIVDVSDPEFLKSSVSLDQVVEVYDHHVGFEEYWTSRIGENARIEFIGAAATLIYREWKKAGMLDKMTSSTAKLLIAAILDNTLNLTSSVTTQEDIDTFCELCMRENIGKDWCAAYFSEVQTSIEADLKNALFGDVKNIRDNPVLPSYMGQVAVWNVESVLDRLEEIREWFNGRYNGWMLNIIDIQNSCNYFICDSTDHQKKIKKIFDVHFEAGIAKTSVSYLRKEIIKNCIKV
jgi:inorganic pyrophosphatase/exopolyphosphatase